MLSSSRPSAPGARAPRSGPPRPGTAGQAYRPQASLGGAPGGSRGGLPLRTKPATNPLQQRMGQRPQRPGVMPMAQIEPFLRGEIQKLNAHEGHVEGDVSPTRRGESQRTHAGPATLEAGPGTVDLNGEHSSFSDQAFQGDSSITMSRVVEQAISPSVRDASAEKAMRKTQSLSRDAMHHLTPTLSRFVLNNKVAIVTGGARGLGLNMAQALCESGIKAVALFDIQPALGEKMADELSQATQIPVKYYNVDVVNQHKVEAAVRAVVKEFGTIDILINSAGIAISNLPAERHSTKNFQKTLEINLVGSFRVARAVGKHMIEEAKSNGTQRSRKQLPGHPAPPPQGRPKDRSIIFIASMSGSIVNYPQEQCAYNASKAGVIQLSKSLSAEWARYGIRCNSVSPGYMDTVLNRTSELEAQKEIWKDRTPLRRLGEEDELDNVIVWLAGEGSRFCTGSDILVDGGYSVY